LGLFFELVTFCAILRRDFGEVVLIMNELSAKCTENGAGFFLTYLIFGPARFIKDDSGEGAGRLALISKSMRWSGEILGKMARGIFVMGSMGC